MLETRTYLAKPTSLLTPDGASRQILVETAWKGRKCLAKSCSMSVFVRLARKWEADGFIPVNGHSSAVDVGRITVFKVLEARIP